MKLYRHRGYSQFYYTGDLHSVICIAAHISHSFDRLIEQRHRAVRYIAKKHPMFRAVAYSQDNEVYSHIPEYTGSYDAERHVIVANGRWEDICLQQTDAKVDRHEGPLYWLILVPDNNNTGHILVCCDHMFSDGMSCLVILRDFIDPQLDAEELPVLQVMELFKTDYDVFWRRIMAYLLYKFLIRTYQTRQLYFPQTENAHQRFFDLGTAHNKAMLVKKCREMNVSVNGAMLACALVAVARSKLSSKTTMDVDIAVDLRRRFDPPLSKEHVGNMYGAIRLPCDFDTLQPRKFWDIAREMQQRTANELGIQHIPAIVIDKLSTTKEMFDSVYQGKMLSDLIVSNMGCYPFSLDMIDSIHLYASHAPIGSQAAFWVVATDKLSYSGNFCFNGEGLFREFVQLCEGCGEIPDDQVFSGLLQTEENVESQGQHEKQSQDL